MPNIYNPKFWLYFFESLETPNLPGQTVQPSQTTSSRPFHDASFNDAETPFLHGTSSSPLPSSSRRNNPIIQSPWERLKREIDLEAISEISSIAPPKSRAVEMSASL